MKPESYQRAKQIRYDLEKWNNVQTRLECGSEFFKIHFHGYENKTMNEVTMPITDPAIIELYKKYVAKIVQGLEDEFEKL